MGWIGVMLLLVAGGILGVVLTDIADFYKAEADIDVILPVGLDADGQLPVRVENIGDFKLKDVKIKIKSCYTEGYQIRTMPELNAGRDETFFYDDEKTASTISQLDCQDPDIYFNRSEIEIKFYRNKTTKRLIGLVPSPEEEFLICGRCYWDVSVTSDRLNKNFSLHTKYTESPVSFIAGLSVPGAVNLEESPDVEIVRFGGMKIFSLDTLERVQAKYPSKNQSGE